MAAATTTPQPARRDRSGAPGAPYREWAPDAHALNVLGSKWTLLLIRELLAGAARPRVLQEKLGISAQQLAVRLNGMEADGLVVRQSFKEYPPRVEYALTDAARDALPVLGALARWGLAHGWDAPEADQVVRLEAFFNLLPALLEGRFAAKSIAAKTRVLLSVTDDDAVHLWKYEVGTGTFEPAPFRDMRYDARLSGTVEAWTTVLAAGDDPSLLAIDGDVALGRWIVAALTGTRL